MICLRANSGTGDSVGDATGYIRGTLTMLINSCPQNPATTSLWSTEGYICEFPKHTKVLLPLESSTLLLSLYLHTHTHTHTHTHRNVREAAVKVNAILARLINLKLPPPASYFLLSESSDG